jgi:hypothetical protein
MAIPPLGFVEKISEAGESFLIFQARACSLPPFPTMRILIKIFHIYVIRGANINRNLRFLTELCIMPEVTILDRTITPNHGEDYEKSFAFRYCY